VVQTIGSKRASAQSSDYRSHLDRLGPGSIDHQQANSLIALLVHCEQTLSAVDEPSNESVGFTIMLSLNLRSRLGLTNLPDGRVCEVFDPVESFKETVNIFR
jgi:hypothetical protein